jgi:hypothetical protein
MGPAIPTALIAHHMPTIRFQVMALQVLVWEICCPLSNIPTKMKRSFATEQKQVWGIFLQYVSHEVHEPHFCFTNCHILCTTVVLHECRYIVSFHADAAEIPVNCSSSTCVGWLMSGPHFI